MELIKLNITQLNTIIKRIIDAEEFLQTICVYGEVSNFKISAGNAYFDIKETGSQLACVKFGAYDLDIHNGDMVLLYGKLNYYVKTGKMSFVVSKIEPYGLGELYKKYLVLKESLSQEGLFDERFKKQLPKFSSKVGIITSETGAVIRDIVHVAKKKNPYTDIIVFPARVQGTNAEDEIIAGLRYFELSDVDVVIIARGGGSFEDMAPFNTEKLVREIFVCKKPIISAVGHETDFSLTDFVADMRAPTPSVAGELAFFDFQKTVDDLNLYIQSIISSSKNFIEDKQRTVVDVCQDIAQSFQMQTQREVMSLQVAINGINTNFEKLIDQKSADLDKLLLTIEKSNPMNILRSGYAVVKKENKNISSVDEVNVNDSLKILLADGVIDAKVTNKESKLWHTNKLMKDW